ncbi:LacI family DNA-binding transcriptional regulator [Actinomadura keratinilytica]
MHSPLIFPKPVGLREAQGRSAADGKPVVLWRPGCMYCIRLRLRLGRSAGGLYWVDIWRDAAGADAARAANDGNETVPTVLIAGRRTPTPTPRGYASSSPRPRDARRPVTEARENPPARTAPGGDGPPQLPRYWTTPARPPPGAPPGGPLVNRPTARDVAELAEVSRAAVSFVFTGRAEGNLSAETQQRIRRAADQLGYRPDEVARSLRRRRSGVIGLLSDEIATSPFAGRLVLGAMEAARERGHQVLLLESRRDPAAEAEAVAELRARRVDGIVYAAMSMRRTPVPLDIDPAHAALANCLPQETGTYASVVPDERAAGGRRWRC